MSNFAKTQAMTVLQKGLFLFAQGEFGVNKRNNLYL